MHEVSVIPHLFRLSGSIGWCNVFQCRVLFFFVTMYESHKTEIENHIKIKQENGNEKKIHERDRSSSAIEPDVSS
uniref:Uncharacterized protein n=1 Tax=Arundo donax TaxID=35708 RepID=A0A0A8YEN7_ARUDO